MITTPHNLQELLLLAAVVATALVLAYLLKPRRRRVEVPFGGLWQRVLQQTEARHFGKRFQRLWSLLLLLAIAGLLLAALGEPILRPETPRSAVKRWSTVLVVDRSASMATQDGKSASTQENLHPTRLDEARTLLADVLTAAPPDEDFLLLTASGHADVLAGWGSDRDQLQAALATVKTSQGGLDWAGALDTAQQMLAGRQGGRVVLISDGGLPLSAAPTPTVAVERLAVGVAATTQVPALPMETSATIDDLAVVDVRIRPEANDTDRGTLTVRVRNDSGRLQPARLVVSSNADAQLPEQLRADAALRRLVEVALPPGESLHRVEGLDLVDGRFGVRVESRDTTGYFKDLAPWNDWGLAVVTEQRRLKILLVGAQNRFVDGALAALGRADVVTLPPDQYDPTAWRASDRSRHGVDLVVLDQVDAPPPEGQPALVLALHLPAASTETARMLQGPELLVRAADHPAMRSVSFADTNFDSVRVLPTGPQDTVLAAATLGGGRSGPVMVARDRPVRRIDWGLDLLETDLVGRYALPILFANAIGWLAGEDDSLTAPLELGRPWAVEAPTRRTDWQYLEPGQAPRRARQSAGQLLSSSEVHGLHVWRDGTGRSVVRPTALPATETARPMPAPGTRFTPRPQPPVLTGKTGDLPHWLWWLAAAALVLSVEWLLYLRRRVV